VGDVYPHPTCAAVGSFDGLHRAHRYILGRCGVLSDELKTLVITFGEHPRRDGDLLFTTEEKLEALEEMGVDAVLLLERKDMALKAEEFVSLLITHLRVRRLLMGYDHRFGRGREGSPDWLVARLKDYSFETYVFPPLKYDGEVVSSSRIRQLLKEGKVERANLLLGYPYRITGEVVKGEGWGRRLGFPTANLKVPPEKLLPADGVYAVLVPQVRRYGVMHIGARPTLNLRRSVEVHILNFEGKVPEKLKVHILARIRGVMRFPSPEALREQIRRDIELMNSIINRLATL